MKPAETPQPKPEFTPPKEGWLGDLKALKVEWRENTNRVFGTMLERDEAVAFAANFHAAVLKTYVEPHTRKSEPGEIEEGVVKYLEDRMQEILHGKEYIRIHDLYDLSIEKKPDGYEIIIFRNSINDEAVRRAYNLAIKEELVDLDLIKEWDYGKLYEKLEERNR